jgi:hypothetical protein
MTSFFITATLLLWPAVLRAQDKQQSPADILKSIKQDFKKYEENYAKKWREAKTDKEKLALFASKQTHDFALRAFELARAHPEDPVAFDALAWMVTGGVEYCPETLAALSLMQQKYAADKRITPICQHARVYRVFYGGTETLLHTVLEKNPDRTAQATACFTLAVVLHDYAGFAKSMQDPVRAKRMEKSLPAEALKRIKSSGADKLEKESEEFYERTIAAYSDVKSPGHIRTFGQRAEAALFERRHLQVGKQAPGIEGVDLEGKKFRLSDYRGKVVVLDFWGNW